MTHHTDLQAQHLAAFVHHAKDAMFNERASYSAITIDAKLHCVVSKGAALDIWLGNGELVHLSLRRHPRPEQLGAEIADAVNTILARYAGFGVTMLDEVA